MKLTRLRVSRLRSIGAAGGPPMDLRLAAGCNVLVGPNGSGKSNVLRALALALDPTRHPFDPADDPPHQRASAVAPDGAIPISQPITAIDMWWTTGSVATNHHPLSTDLVPTSSTPSAAGPTLAVRNLIDGSQAQTPVATRCVVVPAEHHRRSALALQIGSLLTELNDVCTDRSHLDSRLTLSLSEVLDDAISVRVQTGDPATATVEANGRLRAIFDLTTPELVAVLVVVTDELVSMTTAPPDTGPAARFTAPWVVLIDQPETGLHPAAQQRLATALNRLANHRHVSVVFASHSPFMIPRTPTARAFEMAIDGAGATVCTSVADGTGPLAQVVDSLFSDPVLPDMLDRAAVISDDVAGIVVVEGDTDAAYLTLACNLAGRPELYTDLHIAVSHGTRRLALDALTLRSLAGNRPLCVVVDHDTEGRAVAHVLTGRLGLRNHTEVVSVAIAFAERWRGHEWDAEDLLPPDLLARFVASHNEDIVLRGKTRRPDGLWHWDLTTEGKSRLPSWLAAHATADDLSMWLDLLITVRTRMGLDTPAPAPDADPDAREASR